MPVLGPTRASPFKYNRINSRVLELSPMSLALWRYLGIDDLVEEG